ncbi:hypothetical protein [Oceanobacillus kimchii]|uniref:hypothetical protein n=1 Tax=Oceanobacillus kimchii TaxID=746691 RepID=UPI003B01C959
MKKVLLLVISLILLAACGTTSDEESKENTEKAEGVETDVASSSVEKEEELEEEQENNEVFLDDAPTERTVDIKDNSPWQWYKADKISTLQQEGETVFLYSDSADIEEYILNTLTKDYSQNDKVTIELSSESAVKYLGSFISEVSEVVTHDQYFDKLSEVKDALANGNYEDAEVLISEATTIREGE